MMQFVPLNKPQARCVMVDGVWMCPECLLARRITQAWQGALREHD
jgi:hypothetical protein